MNNIGIFIFGTFVTLMVFAAVGLILFGLFTDYEERHHDESSTTPGGAEHSQGTAGRSS